MPVVTCWPESWAERRNGGLEVTVGSDEATGTEPEVRVVGESLSDHRNSLNFLRLVLAATVLASHAASLGDFPHWAGTYNNTTMAQVALYGFFGISGYLIAQSASRTRAASYLWRRVLRIFPGLIVCLVVTAGLFGVVAWLHTAHPGCTFSCYLGADDSPWLYVVKNTLLANPYWTQHTIAGTPHALIPTWNESIWTLFYEFICYLLILALALVGVFRKRVLLLTASATLWAAIAVITVTPALSNQFSVFQFGNLESLMRLADIFLFGSVLYVYRDRIPDRGWLAALCAVIVIIGIALPTGGKIPTYSFTLSDITMPLLAYPLLWLGIHLPFQRVGARNDYSYGIYIYGWPITVLIDLWGIQDLGIVPYAACCLLAVLPFAAASWWVVERPAMRLRRFVPNVTSGSRDASRQPTYEVR